MIQCKMSFVLGIDDKDGVGIKLELIFGIAQIGRKALVLLSIHHEEIQTLVAGTS